MQYLKSIFLLMLLLGSGIAQQMVLPLKIDDFNYPHSWWDYRAYGTVKDDAGAFQWHKGFLKIRLKDPESARMCDVGFAERQGIYKKRLPWLEAEIRVKVLNTMKKGSRGWGFWRMRVAGRPSSLAWFMEQMGSLAQPQFTWSKAGVISRKGRAETTISIPHNQWRVYRVVRDPATRTTAFFIDEQLVLQAPYYPTESLSFHCWIDNGVYHRKGVVWEEWEGESALVVDYVRIQTRRNTGQSIRNAPPVVLYRPINNFAKPWPAWEEKHRLSFRTRGKPVFLLATVRAEGASPWAAADYFAISVDDSMTLEWHGQPNSSILTAQIAHIPLAAGKHLLQLSARESPFIGEIVILEPDTVLVLDTLPLHHQPVLNYTFQLYRAGKVVLVLTGNAQENPGWNHVEPQSRNEQDDGDLTFFLDGQELPFAICGNRVFGNGQTVIFRKQLSAGFHRLEIHKEGKAQLLQVMVVQ